MRTFLNKFIHIYFDKYWFYIGFVLKAILLLCVVYADHISNSGFFEGLAKRGGDYVEQLGTIDNLVEHGVISMNEDGALSPYAGRTPGFIFPYYLFRLLFSSFWAWQLQIVAQIVLTVIASKCMYELVKKYTNNKNIAITAFFILCIFNYVAWLDFELCPESFANSAYVIGIYFFDKFWRNRQDKFLIVSGVLMAWCFFLRGFTIPFLLVFISIIFFKLIWQEKKLMQFVYKSTLFVLPFILCVLFWSIRNYDQFHKFIPLQNAYLPGQDFKQTIDVKNSGKFSIVKVRKLVCAWGGDCLWTYPNTEMAWFIRGDHANSKSFKFPERVFSENLTIDSLRSLQNLIRISFSDSLTYDEHVRIENEIITKSTRYLAIYKNDHPFIYAISPVLRAFNFFNKNTTADWPIVKGNLIYYFKFIPLLMYYVIMILAMAGILWLFLKRKINSLIVLLVGHIFILFIEFGFLLELVQYRYFAAGYMASVFIACYFVSGFTNTQQIKSTD